MIGERIKALRIEKDLLQKELAQKLELSQQTISLYESNKREPDYETLDTIAKFFNTTTDYILGRTDNRNPEESEGIRSKQQNLKNLELSEKDIMTIAAHKVGHEGDLTEEELEKIKLALKIALIKENK